VIEECRIISRCQLEQEEKSHVLNCMLCAKCLYTQSLELKRSEFLMFHSHRDLTDLGFAKV
jgi:hypothetical protein